MKFVILSHKIIPGYGVKGPVMSPATYDIHLVLKWVAAGIDVREVMEDGSYRKLSFNDERLLAELSKKLDKQAKERAKIKKELDERRVERVKPTGGVQLIPEAKPLPVKNKPKKEKVKKEEPKVEPVVEEKIEEQPPVELFIDELEKPE